MGHDRHLPTQEPTSQQWQNEDVGLTTMHFQQKVSKIYISNSQCNLDLIREHSFLDNLDCEK